MSSPFLTEKLKRKLGREYKRLKPLYDRLVDEVTYILGKSIQKSKVKIHSLKPRETKTKTFESFLDKVSRKNIMRKQFEAVEDIAGVRVICLYRSDLEKLGRIISDIFSLVRADTSRTRTETPFGYESDQFIVKLPEECKGPRYDDIKDLKCEIQVRTILMDAWASVSHHLDYKQQIDLPRELRTTFNSLAAVFYVADTTFESFRKGVQEARAKLMKTVHQDQFDLGQEINLDSLAAYMRWKFPERRFGIDDSHIVTELTEFGYENMHQLDARVTRVLPFLKPVAKELFGAKRKHPWTNSGLIRMCLDLTDDRYFQSRIGFFPERNYKLKLKYRDKLGQRKIHR